MKPAPPVIRIRTTRFCQPGSRNPAGGDDAARNWEDVAVRFCTIAGPLDLSHVRSLAERVAESYPGEVLSVLIPGPEIELWEDERFRTLTPGTIGISDPGPI